ncbi:hypothetical protein L917_09062 [Phytophthora nicotianae]|uniref:Uncharacterized protein n=2 Tax=Phytophthora nicotianae TaxID=4792 RepID=W2L5H3_PHYNI|nr:hypothetical protein L917_09062 [Phytophthora nicotianae]
MLPATTATKFSRTLNLVAISTRTFKCVLVPRQRRRKGGQNWPLRRNARQALRRFAHHLSLVELATGTLCEHLLQRPM